jgi:hypothetical protein
MIDRPKQEDKIGGKVQLDHYIGSTMNLEDWKLTKVLDDILMCQYIDVNDDGTEVKRGSIWVPINTVNLQSTILCTKVRGDSSPLSNPLS